MGLFNRGSSARTRKVESAVRRIFMWGRTEVGKSTILGCLGLLIRNHPELVPFENTSENREGARLLRGWYEDLRNGKFPEKTQVGRYQNIQLGFEFDVDHKKKRRVFEFYEVAGEQCSRFDPLDSSYDDRIKGIEDWIKDCDALLIVVSSRPRPGERDQAFSFLEESARVVGRDVPAALVIGRWDELPCNQSPEEFVFENFIEIFKRLRNRPTPFRVLPFSVGTVAQGNSPPIQDLRFEDGTTSLLEWMYSLDEPEHEI